MTNTDRLMRETPPKKSRRKKRRPITPKVVAQSATVKRIGVNKLDPKLQNYIKRHRLQHDDFVPESPTSIVLTGRRGRKEPGQYA